MQKEGDQEVRVARGNGHGVLGDIRKRTWWGFRGKRVWEMLSGGRGCGSWPLHGTHRKYN